MRLFVLFALATLLHSTHGAFAQEYTVEVECLVIDQGLTLKELHELKVAMQEARTVSAIDDFFSSALRVCMSKGKIQRRAKFVTFAPVGKNRVQRFESTDFCVDFDFNIRSVDGVRCVLDALWSVGVFTEQKVVAASAGNSTVVTKLDEVHVMGGSVGTGAPTTFLKITVREPNAADDEPFKVDPQIGLQLKKPQMGAPRADRKLLFPWN